MDNEETVLTTLTAARGQAERELFTATADQRTPAEIVGGPALGSVTLLPLLAGLGR